VLRVFLFIFSIYAPVLLAATQCIEADLILHEGTILLEIVRIHLLVALPQKTQILLMLEVLYQIVI
jgi:hypothetical protein